MTLKEAKALRDLIRADSTYCTIPLGHGPDGYFCRIFTCRLEDHGPAKPQDFHSRTEWNDWEEARAREKEKQDKANELRLLRSRRSPIEIMIDRACGLD